LPSFTVGARILVLRQDILTLGHVPIYLFSFAHACNHRLKYNIYLFNTFRPDSACERVVMNNNTFTRDILRWLPQLCVYTSVGSSWGLAHPMSLTELALLHGRKPLPLGDVIGLTLTLTNTRWCLSETGTCSNKVFRRGKLVLLSMRWLHICKKGNNTSATDTKGNLICLYNYLLSCETFNDAVSTSEVI
jgi:hypothetical protein